MELVLTSIIAFVSTNIDDIFILMLFFANKQYKRGQIVLGQYLGIAALIAISFVGSIIGLLFDQKYVGLLGLIPIYFGIRGIIYHFKKKKGNLKENVSINASSSNKIFSIAAITFANGGDNIGIYIPLFTTLLLPQKIIMIIIFLIMVVIWCLAAWFLCRHSIIAKSINKYGHVITPIILIILGIYILYESGSLTLM